MSGLDTQDLWFWSGSAWWCSSINYGKITTFCCGQGRTILWSHDTPGCTPKPLSGLTTHGMDPAQFSSQFQTGVLLHFSGCCWHSSSRLLPQPNDTAGQRPTQQPALNCHQQSISQDHVAMPLHWFCTLQSPESGSDMLGWFFLWDTDLIEKLLYFLYILESPLPVMCGWAGPLQMVAEKSQGTYSPNFTPANLLLYYFTSFFHLDNRNESVTEHQTLVCAMPRILLPPHVSCSFGQTLSTVLTCGCSETRKRFGKEHYRIAEYPTLGEMHKNHWIQCLSNFTQAWAGEASQCLITKMLAFHLFFFAALLPQLTYLEGHDLGCAACWVQLNQTQSFQPAQRAGPGAHPPPSAAASSAWLGWPWDFGDRDQSHLQRWHRETGIRDMWAVQGGQCVAKRSQRGERSEYLIIFNYATTWESISLHLKN